MGQSSFLTAKVAFENTPRRNFSNRIGAETLTVFDWDDTLMCSTFLAFHNRNLQDKNLEKAKELGNKVVQILLKAKRLGKVYIVTNSSYSWINYTASNFLGIEKSYFEGIDILSCRDCKEISKYDKDDWKKIAFEKLEENFKKYGNIIFIGDDEEDIESSFTLKTVFPSKNISSIKFIEYPNNPDTIIKEIDFLVQNLKTFIGKNLDVDLAKYKFDEKKFIENNGSSLFSMFNILA